jgi:CDP-diacylglycerol--glycerol-3-phosphate 3-phosphatidyltransferase
MATIYDVKPRFQALLRPLCRALAGAGVTANQVTTVAMLMSIGTGAVLWFVAPWQPRWYLLAPAVLFVRMALNAIDGMLAREHGQKSALGGLLNELSDVISDAALYLPMAALGPRHLGLAVAAVFFAMLTEMAGVAAVQVGASRRYDGPMGKSDRAFVFGVVYLLLGLGVGRGRWSLVILAAVAVLSLLTVLNRCRYALREVRS